MEEKRDEGTSANRGSSRGACISFISFSASMGSNIFLKSPGERHHHRKGRRYGYRGRDLLALESGQPKHHCQGI